MIVLEELDFGRAHITVYQDDEGQIVLGGFGWEEFYEYEQRMEALQEAREYAQEAMKHKEAQQWSHSKSQRDMRKQSGST